MLLPTIRCYQMSWNILKKRWGTMERHKVQKIPKTLWNYRGLAPVPTSTRPYSTYSFENSCHSDLNGTRTFLSTPHSARREAAVYMTCARISRQCLLDIVSDSERLGEFATVCASSWKRTSDAPGAAIQPCPWIKDQPAGKKLPYYLWVRDLNRTALTTDLKVDSLHYIAISHTWGRWKTEELPISLPGTPWPIQPNSRSNASFAIMWLNDINQWIGLPAVVEWLRVQFITDNQFYADLPSILKRKEQKMEQFP